MKDLALGANAPIPSAGCTWMLESAKPSTLGEYAALALLPVDARRHPQGKPALFHAEQPWMEWQGDPHKPRCDLDLSKLPAGSDRVLLVLYSYSSAGPISELASLKLQINAELEYRVDLSGFGDAAMILGEFYRRDQQWKFRALAEASAYGLAALGRRLGVEIDEAHPGRASGSSGSRERSSGTGFAVAPNRILTCAHVIEGMNEFHVSSFEGRFRAEPVMVDRQNDMALLRVQDAPDLVPVVFKDGASCHLGEKVLTLGFPLSGLAGGGVHVTSGGVSALFGLHNDTSLLQFTAPIQPGSSGSPLLDESGSVVGMVTSTVPDAQNMNFAVKSVLLVAFLSASGVDTPSASSKHNCQAAEMVRRLQPSLWRIEASNR